MFTSKGAYSINQLDGIGFVVQSALARLTHTQRYIYNSILSIFGKDVSENIFIMTRSAITSVRCNCKADIPSYSVKHFKFNNL